MDTLVPRATARLQLHGGFTFADAARRVPYLAALGVSHLYLSPVFAARPGSTHGYDVTDFGGFNPELGGEAGFLALAATARAAGLGLILDIVPNHMAASATHNAWWRDVLARGPASAYACHFDIDWDVPDPDLRGKVLLPILGRTYWASLAAGELQLARGDDGVLSLRYHDHDLPLAAETLPELEDIAAAPMPESLHPLLQRQHYRLAWWRTAAEELNWRRFFEISELVGVRVERPEVFAAVHALPLQLMREGLIDGVRVDHVDGLADPAGYCQDLRAALNAAAAASGRPLRPWVVVEKILADHEPLRAGWQVDGTTGYDFMNDVSAVLHDSSGEAALTRLWREVSGQPAGYGWYVRKARRMMLHRHLVTEVDAVCRRLHAAARERAVTRDLTYASLRRALVALLEPLDVYRTYLSERDWPPGDMRILDTCAQAARRALGADDAAALEQLVAWLCAGPHGTPTLRDIRVRIQQLMPPLAAKAGEDTAFYRYGRLLSRNEVGSHPATLGLSPDAFHARLAARAHGWPHAMLATATHDHKRGEDTRMRLAVLSELADEWEVAVHAWDTPHGAAPDGADRLMLYQTLVGAWPPALESGDAAGVAAFVERVRAWQAKSIREARRHGSWTRPDDAYEAAANTFVDALVTDGRLAAIAGFAHGIGPAGARNSLTQTLVQLTAPGVPDRYQGTEGWDFSLVDPDNRRPVDFDTLEAWLCAPDDWSMLLRGWRDGQIKQRLIRAALALRRGHPALFREGTCVPWQAEGERGRQVLAFGRQYGDAQAVTIVARLAARLTRPDMPAIDPSAWADTVVRLPASHATHPTRWRDVLTGRECAVTAQALSLREILDPLPVALLVPV